MANETKKIENKTELTFWEKVSELQWTIKKVAKSGKNDFQEYKYKNIDDIVEAVREKMLELGLLLLPKGEIRDFQIIGKTVSYIRNMIFRDKNDGIAFEMPFIGTNDEAAKANGSATTYAIKYMLNMLGIIPDESLDPDNTEISKANAKNVKAQPEQPTSLSGKREVLLTNIRKLENELNKVEGSNIGTHHLKLMLGINEDEPITRQFMFQQKLTDLKMIEETLTKTLAKIKEQQLGE